MIGDPPPEAWYSLIALLFFSMFFSSGETAYLACNVLKIKYFSKKSKKAKRVLEIIKEKNKFLITSLIGNSIVNILVGVVITSVTLQQFSSQNAIGIASFVATNLVLVFGEIIPKSVALVFPEKIAISYSFLESLLIKCFLPISSMFLYFTSIFMKLFKIKIGMKNYLITEDDLKTFFENSAGVGDLTTDEKQIMNKILKYDDIIVKNIMIPRRDIIAINIDSSIEDVINISKTSSLSRFPVYEENIDEIKGILYVKDFIFSKEYAAYISNTEKPDLKIKDFLRAPCFIFANTELTKARKTLNINKQNMAIVIDEYGGTQGIITIEDLNEEIFGDIVDEYDRDSKSLYLQNFKSGYLVEGNTPLSFLNEYFSINLTSQFNQTLAGLIMELCGKMPEKGFNIELEGFSFMVEKLDGNKIEKVLMKEIDE
ncbi:MAG: hemolysin family protein [Treponema sp.]